VISDWEIKLDSISARDVSAMSDGALTFKVRFDADGVGGRAASLLGNFHLSVTLPTYPFTRETSKEGVVTNYFPSLDAATPTGSYPIDPRKAFDLIFQGPDASFLAPVLRVDLETNGAILRYLSGVKGDPSGISGQFGRMLYFSAVVMTTLGLGDIVPMTARSRGLVAAEAIFGITFAGLFINALAYQASMPRKP
jgi:ion channel